MKISALLAGLAAVVAFCGPAFAYKQSTSSTGAGLHWPKNCLGVYYNERGSDDIDDGTDFDALDKSLTPWNQVECCSFSIQFAGMTNVDITGYKKEQSPANVILWRERNWPYSERPVAFTSVTYNPKNGVIVDADIEMNGEDYSFTTNPADEPWRIDVQNTVTHELGHFLGLDHSDDPTSTMVSQAEPGEVTKRTLEQDDIDGACTLYPIEDGEECLEIKRVDLWVFPTRGDDGGCSMSASPAPGGLLLLFLAALVLLLKHLRPPSPSSSCSAKARRSCLGYGGFFRTSHFALSTVLATATLCGGWHFYSTDFNERVHWEPEDCRIPYFIDIAGMNDFDGDEFQLIHDALQVWTDAECSPLSFEFVDFLAEPEMAVDCRNTVIFIAEGWTPLLEGLDNAPDAPSSWAAFTLLTYNPQTGDMLDADILVNLEDHEFSTCEADGEGDRLDFFYTILHEAGHILGLDHSEDPFSVLQPAAQYCDDDPPHLLTTDDLAGLCWFYGDWQWMEGCDAAPPREPWLDCPTGEDSEPELEALQDSTAEPSEAEEVGPEVAEAPVPEPDCCCTILDAPAFSGEILLLLLAIFSIFFMIRKQVS